MSVYIRAADLVNGSLWRRLPVINVDRTEDIPCDWPGLMGVPITFLDRCSPEQFRIYGITNHAKLVSGREPYRRILVRNLKPKLPDIVDLEALFALAGVPVDFAPISETEPGTDIEPEGLFTNRRKEAKP